MSFSDEQSLTDVRWAELIRAMPAAEQDMLGSVLVLVASRYVRDRAAAGQLREVAASTLQRQAEQVTSGGQVRADAGDPGDFVCGNDLVYLLLHYLHHTPRLGPDDRKFAEASLLSAVGAVGAVMAEGAGRRIEQQALSGLHAIVDGRARVPGQLAPAGA